MKKKVFLLIIIACLCMTGCRGKNDDLEKESSSETESETFVIRDQQGDNGIDAENSNFIKKLTNNSFYVKTAEGVYYPVFSGGNNNYENEEPGETINAGRQKYITVKDEKNIPTLFSDCSLIYYSTDSLLDYITWERFYDLGYTVGLYNIQSMVSGRQYIDLEDKDCIVENTELQKIYDLKSNEILLQKIGGQLITKDLVSQGLIQSTIKGDTYDLEVYDGSYYYHYDASVDVHAFRAYELYASTEYDPINGYFYEIKLPDYLVNGYYSINNAGLLRVVRGSSFDPENDNFNERVLYPSVDIPYNEDGSIDSARMSVLERESADPNSENYIPPSQYSSYEPLNRFSTNVEGTLGYVDVDAAPTDTVSDEEKKKLAETRRSEFSLWFPADKSCEVMVVSRSRESTGEGVLTIGEKEYKLIPDRLNGTYSVVVKGTDEAGVLSVSGLWNSYDIRLVNCSQYNNQNETVEEIPTESTGEESESAIEESTMSQTESVPIDVRDIEKHDNNDLPITTD